MLPYENQMFLDILHEDGLVICAKGLGLETVILNIIKVYCDPGNLVLVLGSSAPEENYWIDQLKKDGIKPLPKVLSADTSISEREKIYLQGGVLFVSSRIVVVDLLKHRIPTPQITGFLVCRAHNILESCQESFALRLYRMENKTGFIKAFSISSQSFTYGFTRIERIMKTLFVNKLYLWPRFHLAVKSSLDKVKPEVIELHVELTPKMIDIQTSLLDLINFSIKELKRLNPSLDTEELTVENCLSKCFNKILQMQLNPIWHRLSISTRQLVSDLKVLRTLMLSVTSLDSVHFQSKLSSYSSSDYAHRSSGWLLLDAAETLFVSAKQRLYNSKKDVCPEPNPKWGGLTEILKEIGQSNNGEIVLILVQSLDTCRQLKKLLVEGADKLLMQLYKRLIKDNNSSTMAKHKATDKDDTIIEDIEENHEDINEEIYEAENFTLTQQKNHENFTFTECLQGSHNETTKEPIIILQQYKKDGDFLSLPRTLKELKPKFIVMYDVNMTAVRQIEVFQNSDATYKLIVYFLIYAGSTEEQSYLTTLRREKLLFDYLIKEKSVMVVHKGQDGKDEDCLELNRDLGVHPSDLLENEDKSFKPRENNEQNVTPLVIVDMREFRSDLPVLLHRRGIDIDPVTLQVGDYILSPDMCVERKSIDDLIGSLKSGRLYHQALMMCRHYTKPILLIEFDQNKPFDLQGNYFLSKDMTTSHRNDITSKLQLLTLHFPKLRFVWSPSPYATAELFQELKEGKAQPVSLKAAVIGLEAGQNFDEEKYNAVIKDFMSKLPGITTQNICNILNKGVSLPYMLSMSVENLKTLCGNSTDGEILFNTLHANLKPSNELSNSKSNNLKTFRARKKFKHTKSK
ncbi:DNA repair endonuclease XPF [Daktulosphaira vitifoliae]|uniref:DNA repair endonuclease XPF n=1 Tax=Daktulosphaira vitifoliae TaxID=58002 RepID=UPI0021A98A34|nr:DNA repair endonuclease XPF [Daktulosphaira vitifoliae]